MVFMLEMNKTLRCFKQEFVDLEFVHLDRALKARFWKNTDSV